MESYILNLKIKMNLYMYFFFQLICLRAGYMLGYVGPPHSLQQQCGTPDHRYNVP